jgi:hypothetical protein
MDMTTNTFQIGNTYNTGRGSDYVWFFTVVSRTAKFITIEDQYGDRHRVGVKMSCGREVAFPLGHYSLAPMLVADQVEWAA